MNFIYKSTILSKLCVQHWLWYCLWIGDRYITSLLIDINGVIMWSLYPQFVDWYQWYE